jgi:hypothetical protein
VVIPTSAIEVRAVLSGPHRLKFEAAQYVAFWMAFALIAILTTIDRFNLLVILAVATSLAVFNVRRVLAGLSAFPVSER